MYTAKTRGELATLTSMLPGGGSMLYAAPVSPPARYAAPADRTNRLAVASLVCGLAQFVVPLPASILAIVFGHIARGQIRRTGEKGDGLALAGLALGWARSRAGHHRPGGVRRRCAGDLSGRGPRVP